MAKGILLYNVGESVELFLLIKSSVRGVASNGKPFLSIVFQDKSGEIEAKLWDASEEDVQSYRAQQIVKISGIFKVIEGKISFELNRYVQPLQMIKLSLMIFLKQRQLAQRKCLINLHSIFLK